MLGQKAKNSSPKVFKVVLSAASADYSSTTLYIGKNRLAAANANETSIVPEKLEMKHSDHNLYVTKMEVALGTAPGGSKTITFTLRHDRATKFTMVGSSIFTGAVAGASDKTLTVVGQERIDSNTVITVSGTSGDAAVNATTVIVELTIEER